MKRLRTILNLLFLLTLSTGMTSCQGLIDAIAGDAGNPTTTQPTQPTTPQTPTSEEAKAEAVKLLNDAQKENALVTIYFTLDGQDYVANFRLVGGEYVLQESAGTRGVIQWSNKGDLQISLKLSDISSLGTTSITLLNFTIIDKTTGKTIMQCVIDTENATYAAVSADNCSFGGLEVGERPARPVTLTEQTLEEIIGDLPFMKAATISFATTSVGKTFGDAAFTNELTNTGDGTVTYESSNTAVAEVNSETGEVTIKGDGEATITATVEDTDNYTYETKTATYTLGVGTATMTVTANGYTGTYDAQPHGITVDAPTDATINYGTAEGTYDLTENPTYTDAGTYTVYYQVKKDGYNTVTGSAQIVINKATMTVSASGYDGVYDGLAHSITVTAPSDATIKYGTSADNCTETSLSYKEVGTYTIFYEVTKDNYNTVTGSATVVITLSTMTVTADGYSGTYDGQPHGITVTAPTYASVRYGETEGTYDKTSSPTYTNAGTYTVYYQVKKVGYTTVTGSATVVINKAAGTVGFSTDTVEKLNSDSAFKEEATLTGDGTISGYSSSVPGVATVAADGTVTIISTGTTVITATVTDGTNYKYSPNTATYTLTVKAGGLNAPTSYGTGTNPF